MNSFSCPRSVWNSNVKFYFLKCLFMQCDLLSFLVNYFFVFFFSFLNGVYYEKSNLVKSFS